MVSEKYFTYIFQVNVVVADQKMLGLMIRGGNEFGLGVYITGVDRGSVAENAGLKVRIVYNPKFYVLYLFT